MDVKTMATLAVTLAVAILGYLAKYFNDTAVASNGSAARRDKRATTRPLWPALLDGRRHKSAALAALCKVGGERLELPTPCV